MSRISIDVTKEEHRRLKAAAALEGKSVKKFVLEKTLPQEGSDEDQALKELTDFLRPRVEAAKKGLVSKRSVRQIADEVLKSCDR
ncbi:MAG: DUF1778 domain-containing protein [Nitrosomonadaceae bacterium]